MINDRYRLVGYVCDGSCFKQHTGQGTLTYHQVFMQRPDTCRYAVLEQFTPHQFIVIDLYDTTMSKSDSEVLATFERSPNAKIYRSEDAAIAATQLSYEG